MSSEFDERKQHSLLASKKQVVEPFQYFLCISSILPFEEAKSKVLGQSLKELVISYFSGEMSIISSDDFAW